MTREEKESRAKPIDLGEYKFSFHDDVDPILSLEKGWMNRLFADCLRKMSQNGCWVPFEVLWSI